MFASRALSRPTRSTFTCAPNEADASSARCARGARQHDAPYLEALASAQSRRGGVVRRYLFHHLVDLDPVSRLTRHELRGWARCSEEKEHAVRISSKVIGEMARLAEIGRVYELQLRDTFLYGESFVRVERLDPAGVVIDASVITD